MPAPMRIFLGGEGAALAFLKEDSAVTWPGGEDWDSLPWQRESVTTPDAIPTSSEFAAKMCPVSEYNSGMVYIKPNSTGEYTVQFLGAQSGLLPGSLMGDAAVLFDSEITTSGDLLVPVSFFGLDYFSVQVKAMTAPTTELNIAVGFNGWETGE